MTDEQMRDLVKECGLDWQRGYMPLFDDDPTNRYAVLIEAAIDVERQARIEAEETAQPQPEPDDYAALLRHAREILVKTGTVDVPYEQLGAGFLNVGIAPRLARDLRARFHRDDVNALMVFGTEALRRPIEGGPK